MPTLFFGLFTSGRAPHQVNGGPCMPIAAARTTHRLQFRNSESLDLSSSWGLERRFSVYNVPTTCYIQPFKGQSLRRFVGCERKNLQTALGFRPPLDSNRSSGYRMRSECIEIQRSYLPFW